MRNTLLLIFILICAQGKAQIHKVKSPDGTIEVTVNYDDQINWEVNKNNKQLILPSRLGLVLAGSEFPEEKDKIRKVENILVNDTIMPVVPHKDSRIFDTYNQLTLIFKSDYSLIFRVYNDGVAYRIASEKKGNLLVLNEIAEINMPQNTFSWYPLEESFFSHNERTYIPAGLDTIREEHLASLPALFKTGERNILVTETALEDYPGMWLRGNGSNSLKADFPAYPLETELIRDRDLTVVSRADFIAETSGTRNYPWRVFIISDDDAGLIESNLTYILADENRMEETDWIKPGKVAWDWWNANNIYGVDFRAGINTKTYEYYIDFAAENGIEYVILDEGWYKLGDVLDVVPEVDVKHLCEYAAEKNVGVILWVVWNTLDEKLDQALAQFHAWGAKGIKVDFMQRDDQKVVNYYWRVAEKAAQYKLLVDYHGSYKPAGLRRTWPNVLTREGVKGLEHCKWSEDISPDHNLTIPFIRMVAGPMDYTPGAMVNLERENFNPMYTRPASMGTRAHQMALYAVFESPLQMLADNPANYRKEQECTDFISSMPVTWDETKVIEARIGDYLVIARRKGEEWFLGALTDWTAREFEIDMSFLGDGDYTAIAFSDGINADRNAQDYIKSEMTLSNGKALKINMAPGGGFIARISKE